jgi:hypothetical protein
MISWLTRELASLNEGRRQAVDRRTELASEIKSQLKVYFPLGLQILDNDSNWVHTAFKSFRSSGCSSPSAASLDTGWSHRLVVAPQDVLS